MQLSLRQLLLRVVKRPPQGLRLGVLFNDEQLVVAVVDVLSKRCLNHAIFPFTSLPDALGEWVSNCGFFAIPGQVVAATSLQQLLMVDKPDVNAKELLAAVHWSIADLVNFDDEYLSDFSDIPAQIGGVDKILVAALDKAQGYRVTGYLHQAGVNPNSLTFPAYALMNLLPHSDGAQIAIYPLSSTIIELAVVEQSSLVLVRQLRDLPPLAEVSLEEYQTYMLESLALQIQRAMDYYESQMRKPPVRSIRFLLSHPNSQAFAQMLADTLNVEVGSIATCWAERFGGQSVLPTETTALAPADQQYLLAAFAATLEPTVANNHAMNLEGAR